MSTEEKIKLTTAIVGIAGLLFGIIQFIQVQSIAAARPYLEKKLDWCERAVETAARIATVPEPAAEDLLQFWQLYWGVMGLIENEAVTQAMEDFGEALNTPALAPSRAKDAPDHQEARTGRSLALAHACRAELAAEWSTSWTRQ
ncbi:hypothetical protein [Yoonia sp. R2-816]|uniref:hypothetical protein n=1 Tax=Yoonia sp. R2-816 TaxID=3342638 RepID=UPI00372C1D7A